MVAGCAAEHQVLVPGDSLSADTLRAGGLAVMGVTVVDEVEQVRPPLVAALERQLAEDRPDLPVRSANDVREALGLPRYRRILNAYQSSATISREDLADAGRALGRGARFAIVARVEKVGMRVYKNPVRRRSPYDDSGAPEESLLVSRDVRIRVTLYDLAAARAAFAATYLSSSDNEYTDSLSAIHRPVFYEPGRAGEPPLVSPEAAPLPPELADAVVEGFRAFAADLPDPERVP
jgi:hypothetical protein